MLFGLFQVRPADQDDDIATGTYADGVIRMPFGDPSARPRERNETFRRTANDREYGLARSAGQTGAGMVA